MRPKIVAIGTFLGALTLQVSVVWQDSNAPLPGKLAATFVAALGLAVTRDKLAEVEQIVISACVIIGTLGTVLLGHLSTGSITATVASVALATISQVRAILTASSDTPRSPGSPPASPVAS